MEKTTLIASILIVCYNEEKMIVDCLSSVLDQDVPRDSYEVIVVDNASKDRTVEIVRDQFPSVVLLTLETNIGYPAGMNKGLELAHAQRVIMLSADTLVPCGWLTALLQPMNEDPDVKVTHAAMIIPGDPGYEAALASRQTPPMAAYHEISRLGLIEPHWDPTLPGGIPTPKRGLGTTLC